MIDEDEGNNWCCYGSPFRFETTLSGLQTTLPVIIILVLTRPWNCGLCPQGSTGIRTTLSKTHPRSGWSSAVWFQPSHWALALPALGRSRPGLKKKKPTWVWWDSNPRPSDLQLFLDLLRPSAIVNNTFGSAFDSSYPRLTRHITFHITFILNLLGEIITKRKTVVLFCFVICLFIGVWFWVFCCSSSLLLLSLFVDFCCCLLLFVWLFCFVLFCSVFFFFFFLKNKQN